MTAHMEEFHDKNIFLTFTMQQYNFFIEKKRGETHTKKEVEIKKIKKKRNKKEEEEEEERGILKLKKR